MTAPALRLAALAVATAFVWLLLPALAWPARALTTFLLVPLPALMITQLRLAHDVPADLPRSGVYASSAATLWLLAAATYVAAWTSGFTPRLMGLTTLPPLSLTAWTLAALLALFVAVLVIRAIGLRETPLLVHLIPRTTAEKLAFAAVSVTAGVAEEFVFRGFLIPALTAPTGSIWLAAAISAAAFGSLHTYQGLIGTIRTAIMGFGLAVPFILTGSLLPSMIAHACFNIVAGIWLADWFLGHKKG